MKLWPFSTKGNGPTESTVISQILNVWGNKPVYSLTNYHTMSKEGYTNFVIFSALDQVYKAFNQLNWQVCKLDSDGSEEILINHPVALLLNKPNPYQGKSAYNEALVKYMYIGGEVFIHNVAGKNKELYALRPDKTKVVFGSTPEKPITKFTYCAGQDTPIPPEEILHLKFFNPEDEYNGLGRGQSRFKPIAKVGDMLNWSLDWNAGLMQNGARPSGAFVSESELSDPSFNRLKEQTEEQYSGAKNAGRPMILEGGLQWVDMFINPKDADFVESTKLTMRQIAVGLNVPSILLGDTESTTYSNYKEARKALYNDAVIPFGDYVSEEYNVFFESSLNEGEYIKYSTNHIMALQEDVNEKYKRVNDASFLTINQKLKEIGKDTIGDVGDNIVNGPYAIVDGELYLPLNLMPVSAINTDTSGNGEEKKDFLY